MFGKRFSRALAVTTVASLVMAAAAFADVVTVNDLVTGGDASLPRSATGSAGVSIAASNTAPTSSDANGCNATGATPATVALASSSANVTVTSPSKSYTGCGTVETFSYAVSATAALGSLTNLSTSTSGGKAGSQYAEDSFAVRVIPRAATSLLAAADGQNAIDLSWTASADAADITDYEIYLGTALVGTAAKSATSTEVSGLDADTEYCFTIRARFNDGSADWFSASTSAACATTDAAPTDSTPPVITPTITGTLGDNGWYTSDVTLSWSVVDDESDISSQTGCETVSVTTDQAATTYTCQATSAGGTASQTATIKRDATKPTLSPSVSPNPVLRNGTATASPNADDNLSGVAESSCGAVNTSTVGQDQTVQCSAQDLAGNTQTANATYSVVFGFSGFSSPVDNGILNVAKAGQAIPLKFRVTDANGPVLDLASIALSTVNYSCSRTTTSDAVEFYAAGSSGLQNLGEGYYQYNWKSPTSFANSCKTLSVNLGDGVGRTALFEFRK